MKAYIFDLDGTLLDSMEVWDNLNYDFLHNRGIEMPEDFRAKVLSLSLPESAAYTIERFGLPESVEELVREWYEMVLYAYTHTVRMKPYAKEYLLALKERGAKMAVATSLPAGLYEPALRAHGIYDLFDALCDAEQAGYGKTRPDMFMLAAKKLGVQPSDCVVFEDIYAAVLSAKSIGMTVYAVRDASSDDDREGINETADFLIDDFYGLYKELTENY